MEKYCQKIINVVSKPGRSALTPFLKAVDIMNSTAGISDDSLKKQVVMEEIFLKTIIPSRKATKQYLGGKK